MTPKFFDAHTHLNMLNIEPWGSEPGWEEVGKKTLEKGTWLVNVGADEKTSRLAVEQARKLGELALRSLGEEGGCFATVGFHPTESEGSDFEVIRELSKDEKVVAIGECGLEYYKIEDEDIKAKQCELFIKHIELAIEVGKPLMIHCRANADGDAYEDTLEILRSYGGKVRFNMHFYTGDWAMAEQFLALGGYLSFPGVVTFTKQYDEVVKRAPLDRIMSETDAPFAAPVPHRGERNEPSYVHFVAEHIAKLRLESKEEVLEALVQNALNFFDIQPKN